MIVAAFGVLILILVLYFIDVLFEGRARRFKERELQKNQNRYSQTLSSDEDELPDEL